MVFGLLRFVIAVIVMAQQFFKAAPSLERHEWLTLFGQTFFGTFLFTLCMMYGVQHTTATAAGIITSKLPAAVAILSRLTLKERLEQRTLASILLTITGIAVLNLSQSDGGETSLVGNLFVMAAVLCEATYVVLSKRLTQTLSPMRITAYSHLFGSLLMLPFGLTAALSYDFSQITVRMWSPVWVRPGCQRDRVLALVDRNQSSAWCFYIKASAGVTLRRCCCADRNCRGQLATIHKNDARSVK